MKHLSFYKSFCGLLALASEKRTYKNTKAVDKRLKQLLGLPQEKGIELSEKDISTLYISLDLLGRIFSSNYSPLFFELLIKDETLSDPETQQLIVEMALPNIDNFFKVTEHYAAQTNSLKGLPGIKRQLLLLPFF